METSRVCRYLQTRAIVSEPLNFQVPGDFEDGKNYLSFNNADDCVTKTLELVKNPAKRLEMMEANQHYYQNHLRPDMIVYRTLKLALALQDVKL